MSRNKKRLAVIGSSVAAVGLVIGGVAFAAFNQSANASANGGAGTETFAPLTVAGEWKGRLAADGTYPTDAKLLLPGESGDVRLVLTNPDSNTVQGKVVSITPTGLPDDCFGNIKVATYTPGTVLVLQHGTNTPVILKNAVKLLDDATEVCQGKRFTPTFTVQFQATRDAVATPASLDPSAY